LEVAQPMKIAIDVSPLQSGHKVRGVGFYLEHLKEALLKYHDENEYTFFTDRKKIPEQIDIIHYPYFDPFFLTLPFRNKYKTVVTVHDLIPIVFPNHFAAGLLGTTRWQLQKMRLRKVDGILADSQSSKEDIQQFVGINSEKIDVAYLAAAEHFKKLERGTWKEEIKKKYNLPERFVLYVGDITWNKNIPMLIQAMKEINVTLVMVGKALANKNYDKQNPWNRDQVLFSELIKEDKRFIMLGFVPDEDLVALYNTATVFVFPSRYEGFGLPVVEAMQSGCPVVTAKNSSLKEVGGDAVYYVNENDIYSIANGVGEVFFSEKVQKDLSHRGLLQAKKFSWKKTAEDTVEMYDRVIKL
jgi:glycosyltransferase involved in cell wall biosynthesis